MPSLAGRQKRHTNQLEFCNLWTRTRPGEMGTFVECQGTASLAGGRGTKLRRQVTPLSGQLSLRAGVKLFLTRLSNLISLLKSATKTLSTKLHNKKCNSNSSDMRMTQGRGKPVLAKLDEFPKILRPPAIVLEIYVAHFSVVFQPNSTLRRVQPAKCRVCVLADKKCLSLRQTILK